MEESIDLNGIDLYSIFNSSGSLKDSFDVNSPLNYYRPHHSHSDTLSALIDYCRLCLEKYNSDYGIWDHSRDHAWVCAVCVFTTDRQEALDTHKLEKGHDQPTEDPGNTYYYYCIICNQCLASNDKDPIYNLRKHKLAVHQDKYPSYSCNVCDFVTNKAPAYTLIEHERQEHPMINRQSDERLRHYQCGSCKRLIVSRSRYKMHERLHAKKIIGMRRIAAEHGKKKRK